ncbi:oligosaccharide translocation protein RFT1- variant [Apiospora marii]|uniref:Man(5)GlcNAc(2)-PP-dolichol translocation protein RFT1 n=1 Tax=Apiospora marii TaxID=335849 RepID=A0ABR1RLA1_9PEZI
MGGTGETTSHDSSQAPPAAMGSSTTSQSQGSAVRGASLLIILQVASRAVTFVANQLLLRFLTAQLLGVSTQLEVYYLSVLFFARESLRVAIQRQGPTTTTSTDQDDDKSKNKNHDSAQDSQSVVNVGHLALVLGLAAAVGLGGAYLKYVDAATAATPHLDTALYIYGLAAVVELLSEPTFVVLQHRLRFGPRAVAESYATFVRCAVTFGAASWAWRRGYDWGALPFALGQLGYGLGLSGVYFGYGWWLASAEGFSLLPRQIAQSSTAADKKKEKKSDDQVSVPSSGSNNGYALGYFYRPTLNLAASMTAQSLVKHILTQGDTFLVSILSNPQAQGVYALANNYGSLLARLVFQPVEESSRNYFSKLLAATPSDDDGNEAKPTAAATASTTKEKRDDNTTEPAQHNPSVPTQQALAKARTDLVSILHAYLLLSLLILTLGPFGAPLLVQLIAGPAWAASGTGLVLAQYCLYLPLLALNGIAEAFVSSVATRADVHRQSLWMASFSVAFAAAGFVTLKVLDLGAPGLVYANAVNMLGRIAWSGAFIRRYFDRASAGKVRFAFWADVVARGSMGIYVASTAVLWQVLSLCGVRVGGVSSHIFKDLFTVCALALPYVGLVAYMERRYLLECYRSIRGSG